MPAPRSRRRLLRASVATLATLAGCTGGSNTSTPRSTQATTDEEARTDEFPPDIDERVTTEPPGNPPLSPTGAWPQTGYDAANSGHNPDVEGLRSVDAHWRLDAGGTPVVGDGALYNVFAHDVSTKRLSVRDPETARERTTTQLVQHGVSGPPALGPDAVYVSTFTEVYAVGRDGGVRWTGPGVDGLMEPPTVHDGRVYVAGGGYEPRSNPPRLAVVTHSGETDWTREYAGEPTGPPAVTDDTVVVATNRAVHAFDPATGDLKWKHTSVTPDGPPAVNTGRVYVPGQEGTRAYDVATGEESWRDDRSAQRLVVTNEGVVAGSDGSRDDDTDGILRSYDPATGREQWRDDLGWVPQAATGNVGYVQRGGTLAGFDLRSGDQFWAYGTPEVQVSDVIEQGVYGVTPVGNAVYVHAADALHGLGPMQ